MSNEGLSMRPRVFVSSVMEGFQEYRQAARQGITTTGGEPILVEDYPSLPVSSRTACLDGVASSDVYIVIIGNRGGWMAPSGRLVVEEEYEEARRRKLPALAFIQDTEHDEEAQRLARKLSDYIDGMFRQTFTTATELRTAVEKALKPVLQRYQWPKVRPTVIEEKLQNPYIINNEASLRFVVAPERVDELIDPVSLESPELEHQLYKIGHSPQVGLFSYTRPKTGDVKTDAIIIHQCDVSRRREGIDEVRLELTMQGVVIIDINVTGRAVRNHHDEFSNTFAIIEDDVITAVKKCAAFARSFFDVKDPFKRYERLLYNAALSGIGYRTLMQAPSSTGSYSAGHHDREVVVAFDQPRLITRADFSSFDDQANALLAMFRRRMKPRWG